MHESIYTKIFAVVVCKYNYIHKTLIMSQGFLGFGGFVVVVVGSFFLVLVFSRCQHCFKHFICINISSVQFSSVAQSCPTLCNPMNHSTPGLPIHHQLPEFTQTHVHQVSDAIQPSHPLSSPSPLAPIPPSIRVFSKESTLRMRWPYNLTLLSFLNSLIINYTYLNCTIR